jgi:hypothetical protein
MSTVALLALTLYTGYRSAKGGLVKVRENSLNINAESMKAPGYRGNPQYKTDDWEREVTGDSGYPDEADVK